MSNFRRLFLRVSIKEQILFARNISLMINSGMPLLDSLNMLAKQAQSSSMRYILRSVIADTQNGLALATSLKKFESVFGSLFINIINVGEVSGTLSTNLSFLADELKKHQVLQSKIKNAMIYPVVIIITTLLLIGVLMFAVFPKILPVFANFKVALPAPTRILLATTNFVLAHWLLLGSVFIGLMILFYFLRRITAIRTMLDRFTLVLPVMGPLVKGVQMATFSRTLATLLKSGVKIVEAVSIVSAIMPNYAYKKVLHQTASGITMGAGLGKSLEPYPHLFPMMLVQMIEVSESAGTLDNTLFYLGDYYEAEVDEATKNLVSLLEPLLMLGMGIIVGFIAISIILPIYSVSQGIVK